MESRVDSSRIVPDQIINDFVVENIRVLLFEASCPSAKFSKNLFMPLTKISKISLPKKVSYLSI